MLLFFLYILIGIIVIVLLSTVKIFVERFELTANIKKVSNIYNLKVGLYFLGKICIFKITINNNNISKILDKKIFKNKFANRKQFLKQKNNKVRKSLIELIKNTKTSNLNLNIYIDTPDILLTSYLIAIISTILSIKLNQLFIKSNNKFKVIPLYKNKLHICITLNCIIEIKVIHIINMLKKIGGIKNERSSNRRFNTNSHGKHKKYGRC